MGLSAGPVPARVDATVKAGLLDLIDDALDAGWSRRGAARLLGLDEDRITRWTGRRAAGRLDDEASGGTPVHGILPGERDAIIWLHEHWSGIDKSHRKLAHRGSRLNLVHVSESTVWRVLRAENLLLPGRSPREPEVRAPWPDWVAWKPNTIWCYDFTHFTRARRVAVAVLDIVSRKWLASLVSAEETSTQVEVCFTDALAAEGLDELLDATLLAQLRSGQASLDDLDDELPVLLAMSDNGPQMRSHSTREFMAACAIMQRFGRPGTRPTRPGSNPCSATSRASGRTWRRSATPPNSPSTSRPSGSSTTRSGCTPASATSPPTTNTKAAATPFDGTAPTALPTPDGSGSTTVDHSRRTNHDRAPALVGYFYRQMSQRLRYTSDQGGR